MAECMEPHGRLIQPNANRVFAAISARATVSWPEYTATAG